MADITSGILGDGFRASNRAALEEAKNNVARDVDGSTVKRVRTVAGIQAGSVTSLKTVVDRRVDQSRLNFIREGGAKVDCRSVIRDGLKPIQDKIGHIEAGQPSLLTGMVSGFFRDVNSLIANPNDNSLKRVVVDSSRNLCGTLSNAVELCYEAKRAAQLELVGEVDRLSANIKSLHEVNLKIAQNFAVRGSGEGALEDDRDRLIRDISSSILLDTPRFSRDGTVMLASQGRIILNKDQYASFEYETLSDLEMLEDGAKLGVIKYNLLAQEPGEGPTLLQTAEWYNSNTDRGSLADGTVKGYIELHDRLIPKYIDAMDALAVNLTEQLNKIHNSGSPYPGRDLILGSEVVRGTDAAAWKGSAKLAVVGSDGRAITEGDDRFRIASALNLDLEALSRTCENGVASVRDILNEINGHFGPNVSASCGMGQQAGAQADKKFLLADLRMVAQRSPENQFVFDFEALNTSDFGAKIEILDAKINGVTPYIGSLPDLASVEKGSKARTYQTIKFDTTGLAGAQNIDVKVRVIGSNGQVSEGTIRYNIDLGALPGAGKRISGIAAPGGAGDFDATNINYNAVMEASLVDSDGNAIMNDYTDGNICIKALGSEYKIIIQDDSSSASASIEGKDGPINVSRGFGHYFGLNNLFTTSKMPGKYALDMKIRADIESDPQLFACSRLTASRSDVTFKVGDAKASNRIDGVGGVALANADIININGTDYTFGVGPGQIPVPGNIGELVDSLNARPELKHLVTFSAEGNDLIITAANAGTGGNAIRIQYTIAAMGGAVGPFNLENGTDKDIKASDFGLSVVAGDKALYSDIYKMEQTGMSYLKYGSIAFERGAISSYAAIVTNSMTSVYEDNLRTLRIDEIALTTLRESYQRDFGFDRDESAQKMQELLQLQKSIGAAWATHRNIQDIFFKAIGL